MRVLNESIAIIKVVADGVDLLVDYEYAPSRKALEFYLTNALKRVPSFVAPRSEIEAAIAAFFAPKPVTFR